MVTPIPSGKSTYRARTSQSPWMIWTDQRLTQHPPHCRSTRPGCELMPTPSHRAVRRSGGAPTIKPNSPPDRRSTRPGCEHPHHPIPAAPTPLKSRKEFPNERFVPDKQPVIAINSILSEGQHIVQALKGG